MTEGWEEERLGFPIDFQKEIISTLLYDKKMFLNIGIMLNPDCFDASDLKIFYRNLVEYYKKYNDVPTYETSLLLNKDVEKEVIAEIYGRSYLSPATKKHVEDTVKDFIQCQSLKKAIIESINDLGNVEKHNLIKSKIEDALSVTTSIEEMGIDVYKKENIIDRFKKLKNEEFIPKKSFNLPILDKIFDGGIANGEIFSFIGPSHSGKSMFLVNIGHNMLIQKYNVVHISLEMSTETTIQRYDMRIFGTAKNELLSKETIEKIKKVYNSHIGRLIVKKFPAKKTSPSDIDIFLRRLESVNNFKADVLIVDYADIMSSDRRANEKRHMLEDIYFDLKTIGEKWQIPVITATQMNRSAIQKQLDGSILTEENIAESYAVYMALDSAVTINTTPVERANNRCTLYVAKNRSGEMGAAIPMYVDYSKAIVREWVESDGFFNKD